MIDWNHTSCDYISRSITTHGQMRRLPDQGARHSTIDHGDTCDGVFLFLRGCRGRASTSSSTCGCFLQVERSFLRMTSLLSFLSSLWMASRVNGSLPVNGEAFTSLGLYLLQAQERGEWTGIRVGQAGRPGPARLGPLRPSSVALLVHTDCFDILNLAPLICMILTKLSWRPSQGSSRMKFALLCFDPRGYSFVILLSSPPLGVISSCSWKRMGLLIYSFELVVIPSFLSVFYCKNITFPNAHTKMNLLYH
jgi:hypothetical protein